MVYIVHIMKVYFGDTGAYVTDADDDETTSLNVIGFCSVKDKSKKLNAS